MEKTVKMLAADPQTGALREVYPWSGVEVTDLTPRFLSQSGSGAVWVSIPGVQAIDVWGTWTGQWDPKETKARRMLTGRSLDQLVQDFDQTDVDWDADATETERLAVAKVRGWIMDELEYRDPDAFGAWMETRESSPRRFFIQADDDDGLDFEAARAAFYGISAEQNAQEIEAELEHWRRSEQAGE